MKQTITIIVLTVLLVATAGFAFKKYKDANDWKAMLENSKSVNRNLEQNYNKAQVLYTKAIKDLEIKDQKIKNLIKERKVKQVIYVKMNANSEGEGNLNPATTTTSPTSPTSPTEFEYKDFRIRVYVNIPNRKLRYSLAQQFRMNLYVSDKDDYRAELLEINKDTNKVVNTYPVADFTVIKTYDDNKKWNYGFNLMLGAGGVYNGSKFDYDVYGLMNFISHGITHLDSDWRLLNIGAGKEGAILAPVSYRLSNQIPFLNDLHVFPYVGMSYRGRVFLGLGLATTF